MPRFDGTGPSGQGPMTGRGRGFCVLTYSEENPSRLEGFAGVQGMPISQNVNSFKNVEKEVINMPFRDGTGPAGLGPMTGRAAGFCAGFPMPGYLNTIAGRTGFYGPTGQVVGPYGAVSYGYQMLPYIGYGNPWLCRGFGFGRGFGRGWGRGGGFGRGRGFGWRRAGYGFPAYNAAVNPYAYIDAPFVPEITAQQELDSLKGQAEYLANTLEEIKKRIEELESKKSNKD